MATTSINLDNLDGTNGFKFGGFPGSGISIIGDVNGDGLDDVAISNPDTDNGGLSFIIYGSTEPFDATMTPATADVRLFGGLADGWAGFSVSRVGDFNGDFNGDGIDDFLVGAPGTNADGDRMSAGQTYLVFGSPTGLEAEIDLSLVDGTSGFALLGETGRSDNRYPDLSGYSVSTADINGDGLADLLIGAPQGPGVNARADPDLALSGVAYVVYGTNAPQDAAFELSALDGSNGFKIEGQVPGGAVGFSISGAGDLNGDGYEEIIVGAPQNGFGFDPNVATPTYSYIIYGSATPFPATIDLTIPDSQTGDVVILTGDQGSTQRGVAVSAAGDINGDGYDDILTGTWPGSNAASVVFGGPDILPSVIDVDQLNGINGFSIDTGENAFKGAWLSAAGDVNGDGFDDILVGQPQGNDTQGVAYLIFGTDQGFPALIDPTLADGTGGLILKTSANTSNALGISVSGAGDINGDGFDDLAIATVGGGTGVPSSFVLFGAADLGEEVGFTFEGDEEDDVFVGKGSSDRAFGGPGKDLLIGRDDDDFLFGGPDDDILKGGKDDDTLRGGPGNDVQKGGRGDDTYAGTATELDGDRIIGFGPGDEIVFDGFVFDVEVEKRSFWRNEIQFDTDGNGTLDGSLDVIGVFGRPSFEIEQVEGDTVVTLGEQSPIGSLLTGLFEWVTDVWDFNWG